MRFGRRKQPADVDSGAETAEASATTEPDEPTADEASPRADGPWDRSEVEGPPEAAGYVDLGGLLVKASEDFELQIPTDADTGEPRSVVLVTEDSAMELLAFAASRSGGLWDEIRPEIVEEVERVQGTVEEADGPFGTELRIAVPVVTEDGKQATQPSRVIGVDGPRWLLRATFMGREAFEPAPDGALERAFREVVVVRGQDAMAPREQIDVVVPPDAVHVDGADDSDGGDDGDEENREA